jgi:hypothetical protein
MVLNISGILYIVLKTISPPFTEMQNLSHAHFLPFFMGLLDLFYPFIFNLLPLFFLFLTFSFTSFLYLSTPQMALADISSRGGGGHIY